MSAYTSDPRAASPGSDEEYGGGSAPLQDIRLRPTFANSADDHIDLFVGEHAAGALRKSRH